MPDEIVTSHDRRVIINLTTMHGKRRVGRRAFQKFALLTAASVGDTDYSIYRSRFRSEREAMRRLLRSTLPRAAVDRDRSGRRFEVLLEMNTDQNGVYLLLEGDARR